MVFSSSVFLLYFLPLFLLLYFIATQKNKNYILLLASLVFYSWGEPWFVYIIIASTYLDYHIVNKLYRATKKRNKNIFLALSISTNLGLLVYFKYANFFVDNVNSFLNSVGIEQVEWTSVALPIGISFYTFQTLTYSIDIYRGLHKPLEKVSDYIMYIMMFPQLIAGPIVRFSEVADQITNRKDGVDNRLLGFYRFIIGLSKKVLIANVMGAKADEIFSSNFYQLDSTSAWIGILAYTFQIYYDFAGYSDMAIGLGRMMGFKFPENFDNPYISQNISEFWRRWHITLGRWMKDYLYIPLGGNKVNSKSRLYFNLWFVFLVSGLWHGASWTFVAWGGYHGLFLILDRLFLLKFFKLIGKYPSILITFFLTVMGWVIFKIEDFDLAILYYQKLFEFNFHKVVMFHYNEFFFVLGIAFLFAFLTLSKFGLKLQERIFFKDYSNKQHITATVLALIFLIFCIASITASDFNPFIYFRF
ncbi:MAG: MBOAT family protein [Bacteroidales bacterium]|nr:MBOAT family protein [Bacteroidales bacterium]